MSNTSSPLGATAPNVQLDSNEVEHVYANSASVAPSVDECVVDLGVSTVAMPPEFQGKPMTPEMAAQVKVMFRHESRVYFNWAAAKRFSRVLHAAVEAHEAAFGEIMLLEEREDLSQKAAASAAGAADGTAS